MDMDMETGLGQALRMCCDEAQYLVGLDQSPGIFSPPIRTLIRSPLWAPMNTIIHQQIEVKDWRDLLTLAHECVWVGTWVPHIFRPITLG